MQQTRRSFLRHTTAAFAATQLPLTGLIAAPTAGGWTPAWDQACLQAVLAIADRHYDAAEQMLGSRRGPEYNYQSNLRNMVVHSTRDSFEYALMLLEAGGAEHAARASQIIERTLALQDTDPASKWFGLWSYYREEPLPQMAAVDFNWADFCGSQLVMMLQRHADVLAPALNAKMLEGVARACESIRRRNVTVNYTNIIAQGSFVLLAAAQLTGNAAFRDLGRDRIHRWAAAIDESGSFAEYNSAAYTSFLLEIMVRIRQFCHDDEATPLANRIELRAWDHFSAHWHAPTRQLAGPMSRCYHNDIGTPLWLQKALNNRLLFATLEQVPKAGGGLPPAMLDFRCPPPYADRFLTPPETHLHREIFIPGNRLLDTLNTVDANVALEPVVGSTWLTPTYALGSANRSDFWNQRRPLLAYWGGTARPQALMQLRVMKDDYDFSSALFHSVQQQANVLGVIGFRSDGGDKHPLIDRIRNGAFTMQRMTVEAGFSGWQPGWRAWVDGKPVTPGAAIPWNPATPPRFVLEAGPVRLGFRFAWAGFVRDGAAAVPQMTWMQRGDEHILALTLFQSEQPTSVAWSSVADAGCVFAMMMADATETYAAFDQRLAASGITMKPAAPAGASGEVWQTEAAIPGVPRLGVRVRRAVGTFPQVEQSFHGEIGGAPQPAPRLSDEKILG